MNEIPTLQPVSFFVDDGLFEKAYIKEVPGLYPECRIEYRPILPEERSKIFQKYDSIKEADAKSRLLGMEASSRLKSWSLIDKLGNPVEPSARNFMRLKTALFTRLTDILVFGVDGGDLDPNIQKLEEKQQFDSLVEISAVGETSVHTRLVEEQAKN